MPTEISIEQIFHIIYKRLALLIVIPILFGALTGMYSWLVLDDVYQASSTIIVSNQKSTSSTATIGRTSTAICSASHPN